MPTMHKPTFLLSLLSCFLLASIFVIEFNKLRGSDWTVSSVQKSNDDPHLNRRLFTVTTDPRTIVTKKHISNKWNIPKDIAESRYRECDIDQKYQVSKTGGYCLTKENTIGGNHMYDRPMAEYLAENVLAGKTVVDLGAGLGHYGKIFKEEGSKVADWKGYDGALNINVVTDGLVNFMDLTQPDAADERDCAAGDWVLSLEVGEHIPKEYMHNFLRNIRCHAREGAVISWAQRGQPGFGHVNRRDVEDVMSLMKKWGFDVDMEMTEKVRNAATKTYFRKNIVVYTLKQEEEYM